MFLHYLFDVVPLLCLWLRHSLLLFCLYLYIAPSLFLFMQIASLFCRSICLWPRHSLLLWLQYILFLWLHPFPFLSLHDSFFLWIMQLFFLCICSSPCLCLTRLAIRFHICVTMSISLSQWQHHSQNLYEFFTFLYDVIIGGKSSIQGISGTL